MLFSRSKSELVNSESALAGRDLPLAIGGHHTVLGTPMTPPFPAGTEQLIVGLGCFWGAERVFWKAPGIYTTAVGYCGGYTKNPTYEEVCSGRTGHNEVVLVVFQSAQTALHAVLGLFFESHDPTQGMRQGNDIGTQYRSGIYVANESQRVAAEAVRAAYGEQLAGAGYGEISTEIVDAGPFYYAEDYHQQYLDKVPGGYCGLGGTGVTCGTKG